MLANSFGQAQADDVENAGDEIDDDADDSGEVLIDGGVRTHIRSAEGGNGEWVAAGRAGRIQAGVEAAVGPQGRRSFNVSLITYTGEITVS